MKPGDEVQGVVQSSLVDELEGFDDSGLRETCNRLDRSHRDLEALLEDLYAEQRHLGDANSELCNTIELMMGEIRKLNIKAGNLVEPTLPGGPLDVVGRFWERVRPRDTAVVLNEHVGEIKRTAAEDADDVIPLELARDAAVKAAHGFISNAKDFLVSGSRFSNPHMS